MEEGKEKEDSFGIYQVSDLFIYLESACAPKLLGVLEGNVLF